MPGQAFRSPLMFTKLVSEAAGEPIRLVVLRRRLLHCGSKDGEYDDGNDTSSRGSVLEKTLHAIDQVLCLFISFTVFYYTVPPTILILASVEKE